MAIEVTIRLPRLHTGQRSIVADAARFNVLACGRRFGKTVLGLDRLIHPALAGYPVGWFGPSYKMLAEAWREAMRTLAPIARASIQEHRLELVTGGSVDMWSLDGPNAARGRKYKRVVIDEAAMVPDLEEAWQAAIRPTLTDYAGDAWFLSTPKGMNYFWRLFTKGDDPTQSEWRRFQRPTADNPYIETTEIEAARIDLPERTFAQEYLAQFIQDAGGVFRGVRLAATAEPSHEYIGTHSYIVGVDWGKHADFTAVAVLDASTRAMVALDRFNQIDYTLQTGRLRALADRYRPAAIVAERNSMGEAILETLERQGLPVEPFTTTAPSKKAAIEALALAIERRDLALLPDPVLLAELEAYEATRLPSGLLRYGAPSGMHDDTVMALALAWHGVTGGGEAEPIDADLRRELAALGGG